MQKYTTEFLKGTYGSQIKIRQPEKGYRFSVDPFLLTEYAVTQICMLYRNKPAFSGAEEMHPDGIKDLRSNKIENFYPDEIENLHPDEHHIKTIPPLKILDIGTGSAIIPLLLALKLPFPEIRITAVEIQKELAQIAEHNINSTQMENCITLIHKDIREMRSSETEGTFDVVISNPPYQKKQSSRLNPNNQKAIARHEITLCLEELIQSAAHFLKQRGSLHLIYPALRLTELLSTMQHHNIKPAAIRFVHTGKYINAKLLLISGIKNSSASVIIHPPLYLDEYHAARKFDVNYKSDAAVNPMQL